MFWGLILQPNKRYNQKINQSFHVSMASLDTRTPDNGEVRLILNVKNSNFLICTLQKNKVFQMPLDLTFGKGNEVSFSIDGNSNVHLTGYTIFEDEDFSNSEEEGSDIEKVSIEKGKKRKAESPNNRKKVKQAKQELVNDSNNQDESDVDNSEFSEEEFDDDSDDDIEAVMTDDDYSKEEEEDEDEDEEQEQKKVAKSQKHEKKEIKNQQQQQQKKKHDKQNKINEEKINQEQQSKKQKKKMEQKLQENNQCVSNKRNFQGGVQVEDLKIGDGTLATIGKQITIYYEGRVKGQEKKFDSCTSGKGIKIRLFKNDMVKGLNIGIAGMKPGGKRRITIPPNMGFGAKSTSAVPPNSTLVYEVELKNVGK